MVQQVADLEETVLKKDKSFKGALVLRAQAIAKELEHECMLCMLPLKALPETSMTAQADILLEMLQYVQELLLGGMDDNFRLDLAGERAALVMLLQGAVEICSLRYQSQQSLPARKPPIAITADGYIGACGLRVSQSTGSVSSIVIVLKGATFRVVADDEGGKSKDQVDTVTVA